MLLHWVILKEYRGTLPCSNLKLLLWHQTLTPDQLVTGWLQTAYYSIWIRAGDPKPQPGSRQFVRDRIRIQTLVVVAYLLYTIYEADWQIRGTGDFYQALGVGHDVNERGVQSKFRRL